MTKNSYNLPIEQAYAKNLTELLVSNNCVSHIGCLWCSLANKTVFITIIIVIPNSNVQWFTKGDNTAFILIRNLLATLKGTSGIITDFEVFDASLI